MKAALTFEDLGNGNISGTEHRFWKVLRELGFTDLKGDAGDVKAKFLSLNHKSPFRLGFEVIYTFPSSASKPKWSGVLGVERLFGKKAMRAITEVEKRRVGMYSLQFLANGGAIVALQKDAYNSISQNRYDLKWHSKVSSILFIMSSLSMVCPLLGGFIRPR